MRIDVTDKGLYLVYTDKEVIMLEEIDGVLSTEQNVKKFNSLAVARAFIVNSGLKYKTDT